MTESLPVDSADKCLMLVTVTQLSTLSCAVSPNDTDVVHYNFDADQPIMVSFGRDVAERVCCQMVHYLGKHDPRKLCLFGHAVYHVDNKVVLY